ncbi:MAG TPA: hypothetical protein VKB81_03265 [Nitrospira sp.]|nr:hypothetical protein [Nitrospira sp.]
MKHVLILPGLAAKPIRGGGLVLQELEWQLLSRTCFVSKLERVQTVGERSAWYERASSVVMDGVDISE